MGTDIWEEAKEKGVIMSRLSAAHSALSEWAEYTLRDADYAGHPLWYSTITTIGRWASEGGILLSDQPPKAKIPSDRQTPERVRIVAQAYNEMSIKLRLAVMCKYLAPGTETERLKFYQKLTNHGQATYYRRWNKARELVADRLFHTKPCKVIKIPYNNTRITRVNTVI